MGLDYAKVISVGMALLTEMIIGFLFVKLKLLSGKKVPMLNKFCYQAMFFPLVFRFLANKTLSELDFKPFVVLAVGSLCTQVLLLLLFLFPFKDRAETYIATFWPSLFVNYVIVGIPIYNSIWDPKNVIIVSIITLSNDVITTPVYLIESGVYNLFKRNRIHRENGEETEKFSFKIFLSILKLLATSPIILGDLCGFICACIGKGVPTYLQRIMDIVADGVLGLALFCVGGFLASHSIIACPWWQFIFALAIKFIVFPIIVGLIASAFKLSHTLCRCCTVLSTLPTASSCYMMAQGNGFGQGVSSTMIFWTMALFIPVVLAWFAVLDALKIFVE
ncbi:Auxin Efflux Carrier family protein [Trichomonas vaginalis G3]|uniref:Auxin Efflux Carrier family protein n=1 Tax=Trichomonas vaginalis (strain ATCC PRA-98 / G3) TaxID=412133 RepID=A2DC88_TRIV3|nr:intracellular auxin transport [Trichomonas vaginalis G3]EAY21825.1 Auxin Efflux Carrier family protein [Trichomonas vaginalis G3]KAI5487705.1 intracellular auxin transport [Trichomonas vaginalis G3]|eukprot:XP_001582811.1 Auxin Efflux Carrier family protein [Trichomonas vaginalis G3]